jgi:hypothetical protein
LPVERTLIEAGRSEPVKKTRNIFQDAMGPKFREAVEEATGHTVIAGPGQRPDYCSSKRATNRQSRSAPRTSTLAS